MLPRLVEIEACLAFDLGEYAKARSILETNQKTEGPLYAHVLFSLGAYSEIAALPSAGIQALQGLAHLKLGHFEKAYALLNQAEPTKSVLVGLIDALYHLNNKDALGSTIDRLLPLLNSQEQKTYLRLKAHTLSPTDSVKLLSQLVEEGFAPASLDLLDQFAKIENLNQRLSLIEKITPHLPLEKQALLDFWRGYTLAALGELSRAKEPLQAALSSEKLAADFTQKAKQTLLYLAEKLKDEILAEKLLDMATENNERTEVLDMQWRLATGTGHFGRAMRIANAGLEQRADKGEGLVFLAHSSYHDHQFDRVIACAVQFIDHPSDSLQQPMEDLLVQAARRGQNAEESAKALKKWQDAFGIKESLQCARAEALIRLRQKKEAAALLEALPPSSGRDTLLCICYSPNEPIRATACGETALLGEMQTSALSMHLELFNLYCDIASKQLALPKGHPTFGKDPLSTAAEHLFAAFNKAPEKISARNRRWLCAHFLQNQENHARGLLLFSHVPNPSPELICAAAKATPQASESKKLLQQALTLAEKKEHWGLVCTTLVALGDVELRLGERVAARSYFAKAARMKVQSYDADMAKLALYRLDAQKDHLEKDRAKSDLKDIQLRKTLAKEPLFLDAALLYVDICSENNLQKKQQLLEQMQEDFCSGQTLFGKHYQKQRDTLPEKEQLLQNYMLFVDLNIQSIAAREDNQRLRAILAQLESSLPTLKATSPELATRCQELREQIRSVIQ